MTVPVIWPRSRSALFRAAGQVDIRNQRRRRLEWSYGTRSGSAWATLSITSHWYQMPFSKAAYVPTGQTESPPPTCLPAHLPPCFNPSPPRRNVDINTPTKAPSCPSPSISRSKPTTAT